MNELISNEGDCRTAPATPGLLNILFITILLMTFFLNFKRVKIWNPLPCRKNFVWFNKSSPRIFFYKDIP